MICKHPPKRLYSGFYKAPEREDLLTGKFVEKMWVACLDCKKVIKTGQLKGEKRA